MDLKRRIALVSLIFGIWMLFGESIAKNFLFENKFDQVFEEELVEGKEFDNKDSDLNESLNSGNHFPIHGLLPANDFPLGIDSGVSSKYLQISYFLFGGKRSIYLLNCTFLI